MSDHLCWTGVHGKNPMRYTGGLLGGSWLTALTGDMGNGHFDGAWLVSNFENLTGGIGDDGLQGSGGDNIIDGGNGADVITGLGGNDTITGGAGNDTANYSDASDGMIITLAAGGADGAGLLGEEGEEERERRERREAVMEGDPGEVDGILPTDLELLEAGYDLDGDDWQ